MNEYQIFCTSKVDQVFQFKEEWNALQCVASTFPDFAELARSLSRAPEFIFFRAVRGENTIAFACFLKERSQIKFALGKRNLASISITQLYLFGSDVLGELQSDIWIAFLKELEKRASFDFINLGEIGLDTKLFSLVSGLPRFYRVSIFSPRDNIRWFIDLPLKVDEYIAGLGYKTRQIARQALRKFAEKNGSLVTVSRPTDVGKFLSLAETISRNTYQWALGQRLQNDHATREELTRLSELGQLRCYLLLLDGKACAFVRGRMVGKTYKYEMAGFLPEYRALSPGKVLLLLTIKDLIEETNCELFDFGEGGGEDGYKSKFGNISRPSWKVLISLRGSIRPAIISVAQSAFIRTKELGRQFRSTKFRRKNTTRAF